MKIVKYHSGVFDGTCPNEDCLAILLSETESVQTVNGKEKKVKLANLAIFQDSDVVVTRKTNVPNVKDVNAGEDEKGESADHPYWEDQNWDEVK